jgi:hypothetical protein
VNLWRTTEEAARPIAEAQARSSSSRRNAAASALTSSGATTRPVCPSWTISGRPPTSATTTGVPIAIASTATFPNGSMRDGTMATSPAA